MAFVAKAPELRKKGAVDELKEKPQRRKNHDKVQTKRQTWIWE